MNKTMKSFLTIGVGIFFLTSVGMVAASSSTTQSSPLYPLKMAIEAVTLATASSEDKAQVQVEQVDQRLKELEILNTRLEELERNQKLEQAVKLKAVVEATKLEAQQTAAKARDNTKAISSQSERDSVLKKLDSSEEELDDEDENELEDEDESEDEKEDRESNEDNGKDRD
ncbi:MAG: hypothetical protein AUJ41_02125 [Candidatus Pacebacteria bacterium CG1_02_43_31]|nr:hypothetical protein [Candidatus Paceibacterota bacterium]NCS86546.1 hypothetical protein [Candidatus Paceibacterota bacterium]OIO44752.1 MAG: hypothetical protein AUJ41_02125 [Candidatus Pacebacteria bacterium CG1_02_43_31]PIQ81136.1 MAG: hypothetical protein COV78_01840 [Candidatus Pacebacteria bacterium CG11_big_fil_rev_8_21_14_0_20_34_55]PJC43976.1 MAG: hypothetical protein CO039_01380 [Candidatus Pacebacteria bacterium CG_4_9_14_0_2_um_filter_34_50]